MIHSQKIFPWLWNEKTSNSEFCSQIFISSNIYSLISYMEKAMAPHSSTLAWKIPWMEAPDGLQSMGSRRVRYDWATSLSLFTFMHWRRKWQPTQCSCLENPRDGGAWWAAVYGVAQSRTRLKRLSSSRSSSSSSSVSYIFDSDLQAPILPEKSGLRLNWVIRKWRSLTDVDQRFSNFSVSRVLYIFPKDFKETLVRRVPWFYIFMNLFHIWLSRSQLDSLMCFCINHFLSAQIYEENLTSHR